MAEYHTGCTGTEPYDHQCHLGYEVNHEDWSPFPRVNYLRKTFLEKNYWIDIERLRLVTESYKAHPKAPAKLQCAYAFRNILENVTLYIYDQELILGDNAAPAKAAPVYPEFSVDWILDEAVNHPFEAREHDQFYWRSEEEKQEAIELLKWWQGRTVADEVEGRLDEEQIKGSEAGKKIFQTNLYHYAGTGHLAIDYEKLMKVGFNGLMEEAKEKREALSKKDPEFSDKRDFYDAMLIELGA